MRSVHHAARPRSERSPAGGAESQTAAAGTPAAPTADGRGRRARHQISGAPPSPKRVHDRAAQNLVHQALIEKTHLGLGRMDVHVHAVGRQLDEQMHLGAAFLDRRDAVGLLNGVRDRPIAHHAAIDEDMLRSADGSLLAERRDVAAHRHPGRVLANGTRSGRSP